MARGSGRERVFRGQVALIVIGIAAVLGAFLLRFTDSPGGVRPAEGPAPGSHSEALAKAPSVELEAVRVPLEKELPSPVGSFRADEPAETLVVTCVRSEGWVVPDADVFLVDEGGQRRVGATDARGMLELPVVDSPVEVLARADTFGTGHAWLDAGQREVTLRLASGSVSGRARRVDGLPLEAPVKVVLVPRRLTFESDLGRLLERADVYTAESDLDGEFTVEGLGDEATELLLHCGGAGWLQRQAIQCEPGDGGLQVELHQASTCVFEVTCPSCSPEELEVLRGNLRTSCRPFPAENAIGSYAIGLVLAGLDRVPGERNPLRVSHAFASGPEDVLPESLHFEVAAPGFIEARVSVALVELASGVLPRRVMLARAAEPLGEIVLVDPDGWVFDALDDRGASSDAWSLILETPLGSERRFQVPGDQPGPERRLRVPYGRYSLSLRRGQELGRIPEEGGYPVVVGADAARVELVDDSLRGDLEVRVTVGGEPYRGALAFRLSPKLPVFSGEGLFLHGGGMLRFEQAPYWVRSLGKGPWSMKVMFPFYSCVQVLAVKPGETAVLEIEG